MLHTGNRSVVSYREIPDALDASSFLAKVATLTLIKYKNGLQNETNVLRFIVKLLFLPMLQPADLYYSTCEDTVQQWGCSSP